LSKKHKGKQRYINTKFWDDPYIVELDPSEKLLFLYFLTNPLTNIIGVYEISMRRISFDTGFDNDMILKILDRFSKDNKITYKDGWIIIKNFIKNQRQSDNKEDNINKGIKNMLDSLPDLTLKTLEDPFEPLNYSNCNSNSNCNVNSNSNSNSNSNCNKSSADKSAFCKMKANKNTWSKMPSSIKYFCKRFNHMCLQDEKFCMSQYNRIDKIKAREFKAKGLDLKSGGFYGAVINGIKDEIDHPDSVLNAEVKRFLNKPVEWLEN
jgi:hypothetical protein